MAGESKLGSRQPGPPAGLSPRPEAKRPIGSTGKEKAEIDKEIHPTDETAELRDQPEVDQPGLSGLREAVANVARQKLPGGEALRQDMIAGLNSTLGSAPDGMANSLLAGVSPVFGLYASMVGPFIGGLFSSTQLLIINSTSAAALAANEALTGLSGGRREQAMFALVILVGILQVLFGLLKAGRLSRFVSYSVMTGFLTGVAALMVLSQLPTVTGIQANGANKLAQTLDVAAKISQIDLLTFAIALLTLLLIFLLPRLRLKNLASLLAITIPSMLVVLFGWHTVKTVQDIGAIPRGFPTPYLPSLADFTPGTLTGALAVAIIVAVQGAGVSQSVPNPDGSRRSVSRDILAQGMANIGAGFFRGTPVGGSLSATALSVISNPQTRLSAIFAGVWMAVVVLVFPGLISYIAMPALGAVLIHAGLRTIKPAEWLKIWDIGWSARLASISTFLATLVLPIAYAVAIGVLLSALLYLNESSTDISVVELVELPDGRIEEQERPKQLKSNQVTVLDVYGPLFYASARILGRLLPSPEDVQNPVVILRLRGHTRIGATLIDVLENYAQKLKKVNGRLYISGMNKSAFHELEQAGRLHLSAKIPVFEATSIHGESTRAAIAAAREWLSSQNDQAGSRGETPAEKAHPEEE